MTTDTREITPVAYLRDVDGTGSLHPCARGDAGAMAVYDEEAFTTRDKDMKAALFAVLRAGHAFSQYMSWANEQLLLKALDRARAYPELRKVMEGE